MLRASDSDREQVAQRLHGAMTEGRLRVEEFEERLATAFSARTYGELDRVVRDLPVPLPATAARRWPQIPVWGAVVIGLTILFALLTVLASLGPHFHTVEPVARHHFDRDFLFPHEEHHLGGAFAAAAMLGPMLFVALVGGIAWMLSKGERATRR